MEADSENCLTADPGPISQQSPSPSPRDRRLNPAAQQALHLIESDDLDLRIHAAREIRRLTKTSLRHRRYLSPAIRPLVDMLRSRYLDSPEVSLLALLNLAVRDEENKISIAGAGALQPIIDFLQSKNKSLQEYATAILLTLSASAAVKPIISSSGAIPLLFTVLRNGNPQARVDAVTVLNNLSSHSNNLRIISEANPVTPLVNLLKTCKIRSRTVQKCIALLESLMEFTAARVALAAEEGGVLAVVEVLEGGSPPSREHAVGALLAMCRSDRRKYREVILGEGVVPGLLELTVHGTPGARTKAHQLLQLLRESPRRRSGSGIGASALGNIVCDMISRIDSEVEAEKAKKMVAEMVQVSMERSLRHIQRRAILYTPGDPPIAAAFASKVSLR